MSRTQVIVFKWPPSTPGVLTYRERVICIQIFLRLHNAGLVVDDVDGAADKVEVGDAEAHLLRPGPLVQCVGGGRLRLDRLYGGGGLGPVGGGGAEDGGHQGHGAEGRVHQAELHYFD